MRNPFKIPLGKRKQLFEIQDYSWCPQAVRDGVTELLVLNLKLVPLYRPALPWLKKMSDASEGKWIDLCAGAGGGSLLLKRELQDAVKQLTLTDLYPHQNLQHLPPGVVVHPQPVDATKVPAGLKGFRTLFTSFHHLPDEAAHAVLKDAMDSGTPIGVFEFTERNLHAVLLTLPSFLFSFFLVPFILPWKFSRFFWTYLVPLIPLVTVIDITLSHFRTRTPEELQVMVSDLSHPDYQWEIGSVPTSFGYSLTYLVGMKTK